MNILWSIILNSNSVSIATSRLLSSTAFFLFASGHFKIFFPAIDAKFPVKNIQDNWTKRNLDITTESNALKGEVIYLNNS